MLKQFLTTRAVIYYVAAVVLLGIYGGEVCPFLEGVGAISLSTIVLFYALICFALRFLLMPRWVLSRAPLEWATRQFAFELTLFALLGIFLTLNNWIMFGFPVGSGLKLAVGCLTLGFFFALDLSIIREQQLLEDAIERNKEIVLAGKFLPLTSKIIALAAMSVLLVTGVVSLIFVNDVGWLLEQNELDDMAAKRAVVIELVSVGAVLVGLLMNALFSYSKNLRLFFSAEQRVLDSVAEGDLSSVVPVASRDELGLIAKHTNEMIRSLRRMTLTRDLLGKFVNDGVAQGILDDPENGIVLGGTRRNLAILLSDVRGFTDRTEKNDPEQVVSDLNDYFSEMVKIVHRHQGVVDKFIGDGLLAIFGLEDPEPAGRCAVAAAVAMLESLEKVNQRVSSPMEIGIGVSRGEVVVGNIGSQERLEFTAIGDPVNVAARLEAVTKDVGTPLVISEAVFNELNERQRELPWKSFGKRLLKGKNEEVQVFGLLKVG